MAEATIALMNSRRMRFVRCGEPRSYSSHPRRAIAPEVRSGPRQPPRGAQPQRRPGKKKPRTSRGFWLCVDRGAQYFQRSVLGRDRDPVTAELVVEAQGDHVDVLADAAAQ